MVSQDLMFRINQLEKKVEQQQSIIDELTQKTMNQSDDWDNATLLREWKICERTAATYRKQGLEYFKRGGRIMYSPESREQFMSLRKKMRTS